MPDLLYKDLSYQIRGALYEVYNALGPGFREETYKTALLAEFQHRQVACQHEYPIEVKFKGAVVDTYRLDLVVEEKIILELKAVDEFHPRHEAQLVSYLRASGLRLGILVNFGAEKLQIVRRVN